MSVPSPGNRDLQAIAQMVVAGELIVKFAKGGKRQFLEDQMMQSAIERQFEIMGEAAKRLSPQFRDANPQVPWRSIVGLRDFLIHGYDSVVPDKVWSFIGGPLKQALPLLRDLQS